MKTEFSQSIELSSTPLKMTENRLCRRKGAPLLKIRSHTILKLLAVLALSLFLVTDSQAQFSFSSTSAIRSGELPGADSSAITSYYSDASLSYLHSWFNVGVRVEGFSSPDLKSPIPSLNFKYGKVRQFWGEASKGWAELRVGHFYETFGNGLLLRGFELPGFVYEDRTERLRHRVIQDVRGARLALNPGRFSILLIAGEPSEALRSPENKERYEGQLWGAQASVDLPGAVTIGGAYLEFESEKVQGRQQTNAYATRFMNWSSDDLLRKIGFGALSSDFRLEYATEQGTGAFGNLDEEKPQAFYAANNITIGAFGLSSEYKNYRRFETHFNDLPAVIRESPQLLLNRATHAIEATNQEKGYQFEAFWAPVSEILVTGNYTLAKTYFGSSPNRFNSLFRQRLLLLEWLKGDWTTSTFFETGEEQVLDQQSRITAGVGLEKALTDNLTIGGDFQWQEIEPSKNPIFPSRYKNLYYALRFSGWQNTALAFNVERTSRGQKSQERFCSRTSVASFKSGVPMSHGGLRQGNLKARAHG